MANDLRWRLAHDGKTYEFNAQQDLTVSRLRQVKAWYGSELGRWSPFILALGQGDPDAWACALWIARVKSGEKGVPEPAFMDFAVGEVMSDSQVIGDDDANDGPDPTEDAPTPDSTPTSTGSEPSTSST